MAVRDSDTLLWLHNKLGVDDSWGSGNIASLLNADVLRNVIARHDEVEPKVKMKLLLSFINIRPDAMEGMKNEVCQVINACARENNSWLQLIAEILRPFPKERRLECDVSDGNSYFRETLERIREELANREAKPLLPLVSSYLNKNALEALVGPEVKPPKHFELRTKMKSELLREELLRKSKLAADASETKKHSACAAYFPSKTRSVPFETQLSEPASVGKRAVHSHSGSHIPRRTSLLAAPSVPTKPSTIKRDPKIQLIDLSEAPMVGKKRRREKEIESAAKRLDVSAKTLAKQRLKEIDPNRSSLAPPTPHYAAALGIPGHSPPASPQQPAASFVSPALKTSAIATPSYAVVMSTSSFTPTEKLQASIEAPAYIPQSVAPANTKEQQGVVFMTTKAPVGFGPVLTLTGGQTLVSGTKLVAISNPTQPSVHAAVVHRLPETGANQNQAMDVRAAMGPVPRFVIASQPTKVESVASQEPVVASQPETNVPITPQLVQPQVAAVPPPKKELRLTREQLTMAQEMFKNANKVTRDDKAIILSFMAGSRENPYPNQGELVTVLLNQTEEHVKTEGAEQRIIIEILFEMNYKTGQWRRLQRKRIMQLTTPATT